MDIKREGVARKKRIKFAVFTVLGLAAAGAATYYLSKLKPADRGVEWATILPGTVKRGSMLIDVKGTGVLVPEDIVWIPAAFESQVSKILVSSGDRVKADTILMVLTNPDMDLAANDLEWQIRQADASLTDTRVQLESKRLDQQSAVASVESDLKQAQLNKDTDEQLLKMKLKSELEVKLSVAKWEQLQQRAEIEKKRLEIMTESTEAQLDSQRVQVEKLKAQKQLKKQQVAELTIRAGDRRRPARNDTAGRPKSASRRCAGEGRAAVETESRSEDRRDAGQGHHAGTGGADRYTERNHPCARYSNRSECGQWNAQSGLQTGRALAARSGAGSKCGWNGGDFETD